MKPVNEMDLKFLSRSSNESFARAAVAAFVAQIDPTIDELADIKTAVSEAVTNCIVHAYREDLGMIYINVKLFENGTIAIRVRERYSTAMYFRPARSHESVTLSVTTSPKTL